MFIWTTKIDRRRIALVLTAAAVLCGALLTAVHLSGGSVSASAAVVENKRIRTAEDRVRYLSEWGWTVQESSIPVEELSLPKEFGPEYSEYLSLQSDQGFDLTRFAGKRVRRYTFDVLNDPTGEPDVKAHLLICRNRVVAGEIFSPNFIRGLSRPEQPG